MATPASTSSARPRTHGRRDTGSIRWSRGHAYASMVVLEDRVQRPRREAVEARLRAPRRLERVQRGGVGQRRRVHQREVRALPELRAERVRGIAEQHQRAVVPVPAARRCGRRPAAAGPSTQAGDHALGHRGEREQVLAKRRDARARTASIRSSRTDQNTDTALAPGREEADHPPRAVEVLVQAARRTCRRGRGTRPTARPSGARGCGRGTGGSAAWSSARRRRRRSGVRAVARAARVDQRPVLAADDLDARQERRARPLRRPAQRGEERAAVHAEAVDARPQPRIGEVHEAPARDGRADAPR